MRPIQTPDQIRGLRKNGRRLPNLPLRLRQPRLRGLPRRHLLRAVPDDVRKQGPWQGQHRGELADLNTEYLIDIEVQGYALVRCDAAVTVGAVFREGSGSTAILEVCAAFRKVTMRGRQS